MSNVQKFSDIGSIYKTNKVDKAGRSIVNQSNFHPETYVGSQIRDAERNKRSLIIWDVPHVGSHKFIEMYINPQSIRMQSQKEIQTIRTKGGYVAQYWGEKLDQMTINGITGDSGIEGLNVLRDIYRSELLSMSKIIQDEVDVRKQSLMQLAASVTMHYQEQSYRGFFTQLQYTESVDHVGYFEYTLMFSIVEIKGSRNNFLPWHRHPWSTTETPSAQSGGYINNNISSGYNTTQKVGVMNVMPHELEHQTVIGGEKKISITTVAVLRLDPKDLNSKGARNMNRVIRGSASYNKAAMANKAIAQHLSKLNKNAAATKLANTGTNPTGPNLSRTPF